MTALERLYNAAVVPVVVLDDAADAVPTAKALLAGGGQGIINIYSGRGRHI